MFLFCQLSHQFGRKIYRGCATESGKWNTERMLLLWTTNQQTANFFNCYLTFLTAIWLDAHNNNIHSVFHLPLSGHESFRLFTNFLDGISVGLQKTIAILIGAAQRAIHVGFKSSILPRRKLLIHSLYDWFMHHNLLVWLKFTIMNKTAVGSTSITFLLPYKNTSKHSPSPIIHSKCHWYSLVSCPAFWKFDVHCFGQVSLLSPSH